MRQRWRDLLFLHWPIDPATVQSTLPPGLQVDTYAGQTYLGVVPFEMCRVRPVFLPPLPGLSWFGELNLRTYVRSTTDGRPGVYFYSLDADQRVAVWLARRFFALPYHKARIRINRQRLPGDRRRVEYRWTRDPADVNDASFRYETPAADLNTEDARLRSATPGTLQHFLIERYLLYSSRPLFLAGPGKGKASVGDGSNPLSPPAPPRDSRLYVGRVDHAPYRIAPVETEPMSRKIFTLNGWTIPAGPPVSALWSPGVDVRIHPLFTCATK